MAADVSQSQTMGVGPPADVAQLRRYFSRVVPVLFDEEDTTLFESALQKTEPRLKVFIEDSQEHVLTILRTLPPEEVVGETGSPDIANFRATYSIFLGVQYRSSRCVGVVFIKRGTMIEADKSVQSQLRLMQVSEDSLYETLHAYVQNAVTPLFNSYIQQGRREER